MKKQLPQPIIPQVLIGDLAEGNYCVTRVNNQVIFVDQAAPGDIMDIQIIKKKRGYATAIPVHLHTPSPARTTPFCSHFGVCGGCQWQHVSYPAQLAAKEQLVKDKLIHLARIHNPPVAQILGADPIQYYRNKLEYTFSNKRWLSTEEIKGQQPIDRQALGFHKPGYFDKVVEIQHCYLQGGPSNDIRLSVGHFAREQGMTFYDFRTHEGDLRNLIIRTTSTGEVMVIVQFGTAQESEIEQMMQFVHHQFPQLTSLQYVVNTKFNETFYDLPVHCYAGKPFITEVIDGLQWQIGPKSFFQTNATQAGVLYRTVANLANLQGDELVFDLYTGVGTIAHYLARQARHVVGIEMIEGAIQDAQTNATLNQLKNVSFYVGDMKDILQAPYVAAWGKPQVVVTDPPRAGMHPDVVQQLLALEPEKIVYVSCNPATQARDIALLATQYQLVQAQPIDMFPHTSHVENVALLVRK